MLKRPSPISGGHILWAALIALTQGQPCLPGTLSSRLRQSGQPGIGGCAGRHQGAMGQAARAGLQTPGSSGELPACTQMPRKRGRLTASLPFTKGESELQSPGHLGLHCLTRSAWEGRPLRPQSRTPSHLAPHLLGHQIPLPHALPPMCTMVQALVHLSENLCPRSANL